MIFFKLVPWLKEKLEFELALGAKQLSNFACPGVLLWI